MLGIQLATQYRKKRLIMSNDNARLFDDLTRVAGGAVSVLSAIGKQVQAGLQEQVGKNFSGISGGSADVERLQGVITKMRIEQEDLKKRVAELEAMVGVKKKSAPADKAAKKAPAKAKAKKAPAKKSSRK